MFSIIKSTITHCKTEIKKKLYQNTIQINESKKICLKNSKKVVLFLIQAMNNRLQTLDERADFHVEAACAFQEPELLLKPVEALQRLSRRPNEPPSEKKQIKDKLVKVLQVRI